MVDVGNLTRRVKVYQLNDTGQWDDKGTGFITCRHSDIGDSVVLSVKSEDTGQILLEHKVEANIDYQRQGDTIITWCDDVGVDLALSFQEVMRSNEVWEQIANAQAKCGEDQDGADRDNEMTTDELLDGVTLPPAEAVNLDEICARITQVQARHKDHISSCLLKDGYLKKLLDVFRSVEEEEQLDSLFLLFNIFKGIFMLNDVAVFEQILSEELVVDVIGTLEYDPDLPPGTSYGRHRDFLAKARFSLVVPLNDEEVTSKIHQNFRMIYIKDVALLRYLDDPTIGTLTSMILYNNLLIVTRLSENVNFMKELFFRLKKVAPLNQLVPPTPAHTSLVKYNPKGDYKQDEGDQGLEWNPDKITFMMRKNLFLFLQELCNLTKTLQVPVRDNFYKTLVEYGVFEVIEEALINSDPKQHLWTWLIFIDILAIIVNHDSSFLRNYIMTKATPKIFGGKSSNEKSFLGLLFETLISESVEYGLCHQLAQLLQTLLDDGLGADAKTGTFLEHVYSRHMPKILTALKEIKHAPGGAYMRSYPSQYHAVELLSFCVQQHGPRARKFLLRSQGLSKISELVKLEDATSSRQLSCSVVRFFRTTIGLKQDPYYNVIVSKKLLDPILEVFVDNGSRYNLLNSVVIELINFIRAENIRPLINYIITDHENKFQNVNYVQTFKALKHRWKQNQDQSKENLLMKDSTGSYSNGLGGTQTEDSKMTTDEIEEDMFSRESDSDDEEKEAASKKEAAGGGGGGGSGSPKLNTIKKEVDPEEEAKFLQNMEELKKKKRKLDEDRNEFDFQKLGSGGNNNKGTKGDTKNNVSKTGPAASVSPPKTSKTLQIKPSSPPSTTVGGGGTYLQTDGSPKRRKGSR